MEVSCGRTHGSIVRRPSLLDEANGSVDLSIIDYGIGATLIGLPGLPAAKE
jgi:hypothetical protein